MVREFDFEETYKDLIKYTCNTIKASKEDQRHADFLRGVAHGYLYVLHYLAVMYADDGIGDEVSSMFISGKERS